MGKTVKTKAAAKPGQLKSEKAKSAAVKAKKAAPSTDVSAKRFIERLKELQSDEELRKIQGYFKSGEGQYGEGDKFMGVRMGELFALSVEFIEMPPAEIEKLLEHSIHEVRAGAMSIMNKQARNKKTPESRRKELYDLYLRRHDRINNWDLVDLAAAYVIGGYLFDKPRDILYQLARSTNVWERRTAIYSTYYFLRLGQLDDTFQIAEILIYDDHDLIQKAAGGWLRTAGEQDPKRLKAFLDRYAASMPRTALRYAIERLEKKRRDYYLGLKKVS
jgi:3-methyladenine DNA glycosylase AlkD